MPNSFKIQDILDSDDPRGFILADNEFSKLISEPASKLLDLILSVLPDVKRFQNNEAIEYWKLEINITDDEGIEFCICHEEFDLIILLLEDDDEYSTDDVRENLGLESFYINNYHVLLGDEKKAGLLLLEVNLWAEDSFYHPNALTHLQAVVAKKFELSTFGGAKTNTVELTFDEDEIFVSNLDNEDQPDYHMTHEQFNPKNPEESIEAGIQSWSLFDEEDDDWEDIDDFDEIDKDMEEEGEWDPDYDDYDLEFEDDDSDD